MEAVRPASSISTAQNIKIELDTIFETCNKLNYCFTPEQLQKVQTSCQILNVIRYAFTNREIRCTTKESEELITLFNKTLTAVKKAAPSSSIEPLPNKLAKSILDDYPAFNQLPLVEQNFISNLTPKNLGHLIGDSYVLGMVDSWGNQLEGNSTHRMIHFLLNALDYLPTKYPEKFIGNEKEISHAKLIFTKCLQFSADLEKIQITENTPIKEKLFKEFVSGVQSQLSNLKENETLLLPWGWATPSKIGHSMLMSYTRRNGDLFLEVINTGEGTQFTMKLKKKKKTKPYKINTISHFNIPAEKEQNFYEATLSTLFEPKVVGAMTSRDSPMYGNRQYSSEELYGMLGAYCLPRGENRARTELIKVEQQSGTCAFKCVFACFGKLVPNNFHKEFKFLWEQEVESQLLHYNKHFLADDPLYEMFLNRLNPNLFRHIGKLQRQDLSPQEEQQLLEKFEREQKEIEALTKRPIERNEALSNKFIPQWAGTSIAHVCQHKKEDFLIKNRTSTSSVEYSDEESDIEIETIPRPVTASQITALDPKDFLLKLKASLKFFKQEAFSDEDDSPKALIRSFCRTIPRDFYLGEQCLQISSLFLDPSYEKEKRLFLENLRKSPLLIEEVIIGIAILSDLMFEKNQLYTEIAYSLGLEGLNIVIFDLAVLKDDFEGVAGEKRIDYYNLKFQTNFDDEIISPLAFNTPAVAKQYHILKNAYAQRFNNIKKPTLFNPENWQIIGNDYSRASSDDLLLPLNNSSPEFQYASQFIDALIDDDKIKAHDDYLKHLKQNPHSQVNEKIWLIGWMMTHQKVPMAFQLLFSTSMNAIVKSPTSFYTENRADMQLMSMTPSLGLMDHTEINLLTPLKKNKVTNSTDYEFLQTKSSVSVTKVDIVGEEYFPLHSLGQNEGLCEFGPKLKEIIAILSVDHLLQVSMLLDYYRRSPELLLQPEHQTAFQALLFAPNKLANAIMKNPPLEQDLIGFFEELSARILLRKVKSSNQQEIQALNAFILEQKVYAYQILETNKTGKALIGLRKEIEIALANPEIEDPITILQLRFAYIGTFASTHTWKGEDIQAVLSQFHQVLRSIALLEDPERLTLGSYLRCVKLINEKMDSIINFLQSKESREWIGMLLPGEKITNWKLEPFPLISVKTANGMHEIDFLTGENLTRKVGKIGFVPDKYLKSTSYKKLFQNKRVLVETKKGFDQLEHMGITYKLREYNSISPLAIERQIDGKQHLLILSEDLGIDFIPESNKWQLWLNVEDQVTKLTILDNTGHNNLGVIDDKGIVHLNGPPAVQYQYSNKLPWSHPFIEASKHFLWTKKIDLNGKVTDEIKIDFTDENSNEIGFTKINDKWCLKSDPSYFIAEDQKLVGLQLQQKYLILQNLQGHKIAIVLELPNSMLAQKEIEKAQCLIIDLNPAHEPEFQNSPYKNSFVAYHLMMQAKNPQDYIVAFEFLKRSHEFRPYNDKELKFLGLIIYSNKEKPKDDPEVAALRLYSAFLIHDNIIHYPRINENSDDFTYVLPKVKDSENSWRSFLTRQFNGNLSHSELNPILRAYFRKRNNLPAELKIEKNVPTYDLEQWGFSLPSSSNNSKPLPKNNGKYELPDSIPIHILPDLDSSSSKELTFFTRLDDQFNSINKSYFSYYYGLACSPSLEDRKQVLKLLQNSTIGSDSSKKELCALLVVALEANDEQSPVKNEARSVLTTLNQFVTVQASSRSYLDTLEYKDRFKRSYDQFKSKYQESFFPAQLQPLLPGDNLQDFSFDIFSQFPISESIVPEAYKAPSIKAIPLTSTKLLLPKSPATTDFPFTANSQLFADFQNIGEKYFYPKQNVSQQPKELFSEIIPEVKWLNEEYVAGYQQNLISQTVAAKGPSKDIRRGLLNENTGIEFQNQKDLAESEMLGKKVEHLGNEQLKLSPRQRAKVGGGKKKYQSLDDLILLALKGDSKEIKKATAIRDPSKQKELVGLIGQYLELEMRLRHSKAIIGGFEELAKAPEDNCDVQLNALQELLQTPCALVQHDNQLIQLTFQHFIELQFRKDQVEGLDAMIKADSNHFMQRSTGAGKTLIFAHPLAYYKADGYHLSIHVSPTYQFASQIYEMSDRSQTALRQKSRALVFYDSPAYFNVDYLSRLNDDLTLAIINKTYFNTTKITLRTLWTAYVHSSLEYYGNSSIDDFERKKLKPKIDLLREINAKIRSRGLLTFDEVHDAQSPKDLLCKGVGEITTLDSIHIELISSMLMMGIEKKKMDGSSLTGLKENLQAQMSEEEKIELAKTLVLQLTSDKKWLKKWDCENLSLNEIEALRTFILEKESPIPAFLAKRIAEFKRVGNAMTPLDHLLLCRQLIAGKWLFGALSKSVYEHHGVIYQQDMLPISVPFTANLKPSKKSEFSDPYQMGLNTLMDYHVQGLNIEQTKELIESLKSQAIEEFEQQSEMDPEFKIQETEAFVLFAQISAIPLTDVNNDLKSLPKVQKALQGPSHAAMALLSDYVSSKVLKKKNLLTEQVSCNGMNTAAMAKNVNGFSATIDDEHIAPVMDFTGKKTVIETEKGVYGQRVDLLLRKHTGVYVMGDAPEDLFKDVYHKLPEEKRSKVRAVIDVGCHFKGVDNKAVAEMMCKEFQNSAVEGIIFYDIETDRPYFMQKSNPNNIRPIISFKTKVVDGTTIFEDINVSVNNVGVYFSHDKITGTNIPLWKEAVAISTCSESTKFFEKVQGDGRMRQMETQEIVTAVQQGFLNALSDTLGKQEISQLPKGKIAAEGFIRDVVLYTFCLQAKGRKADTFTLCMQNMQSCVQQYLLDKVFLDPQLEKDVFTLCQNMFKEDITIDFVRDYATAKEDKAMTEYLTLAIRRLLISLVRLKIDPVEISTLKMTLEALKDDILPDLEPKIQINKYTEASNKLLQPKRNADSTMVQVKQSKPLKVQDHLIVQNWVQERIGSSKIPAKMQKLKPELLFSPYFGMTKLPIYKVAHSPENTGLKIMQTMYPFISRPEFKRISLALQNQYKNEISNLKNMSVDIALKYLDDFTMLCNDAEKIELETFMSALKIPIQKNVTLPFTLMELNSVLKQKFPSMWTSNIFSNDLIVTKNFMCTIHNQININDEKQKPLFHLLLIQDAGNNNQLVILSAEDAAEVAKSFESKEGKLPDGRKMWLLRPQGDLAWTGPCPYNKRELLENTDVRELLIQANFFAGNLYTLENPFWQRELRAWLAKIDNLKFARSYFENAVLKSQPNESYTFSKTKNALANTR